MSALNVFTEFVLRRDNYMQELRALETATRATAQRLSATQINLPIRLGQNGQQGGIQQAIAQAQQQANANPIVVPIVYGQPQGGAPGMPGVGAAGAGAGNAGGRAQGGMFGIPGLRSLGILGAAHFAARNIGDVAEEIGEAYTLRHAMGADDELGRMQNPMDQAKAMRAAIEKEHSGVRGATNWVYAKLGWQPTYSEEIGKLDESERSDKLADTRRREAERAVQLREQLRRTTESQEFKASIAGKGGFTQQIAEIGRALVQNEEAAKKIEDAWKEFGFTTYSEAQKAADRIRASGKTISDQDMADLKRSVTAADFATQHSVKDFEVATRIANLRAAGQSNAAALIARQYASSQTLVHLDEQIVAEKDPDKRTRLQKIRDAAASAAEAEGHAVDEEDKRRRENDLAEVRARTEKMNLETADKPHEAEFASLRSQILQSIKLAEDPELKQAMREQGIAALELEKHRLEPKAKIQGIESLGQNLLTAGFGNNEDLDALRTKIDDLETQLKSGGGAEPEMKKAGEKLSEAGDAIKDALDGVTHIAVLDFA